MDTTYNVTRSKQLRLGIQELLGSNSRGEIDMSRRSSSSHRPPLPPSFGASFSVRIAVPIFQMVRAAPHRYAAPSWEHYHTADYLRRGLVHCG